MVKVNNSNTRAKYEICSKLTKKTPGWHHFFRSGVLIVSFEHILHINLVSMLLNLNRYIFAENLCFGTLSTPERNGVIAVSIVNFEQTKISSSVSTVDFEHVFFEGVLTFCIPVLSRLWWIQVPFIQRKDFHNVKYSYNVAHTLPQIFFSKFILHLQTGHVSSAFVERHLSFIICLGQKSVGSCPRSNFLGVVVQGVIFRKNCPCSKSSGGQLPWENFMGDNYTGANCSGRNIQRYFSGRQNCRR